MRRDFGPILWGRVEIGLNFLCLGLACLLNKPKTKVLTWLVFKQTNINEYRLGLFLSRSSPIVNELVHDFFLGLSHLLNKPSYLSWFV